MRVHLTICGIFLATSLAFGEDVNSEAIVVEPHQAVIQVNGIVCSFCAYGTEKNLSKLTFLDKSKFGDDGVLIDIKTHRITLALQPDQVLDFAQVFGAITKGGYDPVSFYVNVYGQVRKSGDRFLLTSPDSGQVFEIIGSDAEQLVEQGPISVKGRVDAERVATINAYQPIPVVIASTG